MKEETNLINIPKTSEPSIERRTVIFSKDLDRTVEGVRRNLGMSRSGFIKYAVVRLLEDLSILSEKAHEKPESSQSRLTQKHEGGEK